MDATNAIAAIELIREAVGLPRRATAHEIVCEVSRLVVPQRRLMAALAARDEMGPRVETVTEVTAEALAVPVPVPEARPKRRAVTKVKPAREAVVPRAPVILPSLTRAPVKTLVDFNAADRLKIIKAAAERMRR